MKNTSIIAVIADVEKGGKIDEYMGNRVYAFVSDFIRGAMCIRNHGREKDPSAATELGPRKINLPVV